MSDKNIVENERETLIDRIQELLLRAYLLASCTIISLRTRDIASEMRKMGFTQVGSTPPKMFPLVIVFAVLSLGLLLIDAILNKIGIGGHVRFDFVVLGVFNGVITYGTAALVAIAVGDRLERSGLWHPESGLRGNLVGLLLTAGSAYVSCWLLLSLLVFATVSGDISKLAEFATFRSLAPALGAALASSWIGWKKPEPMLEIMAASISVALVAGLSSIYLYLDMRPFPFQVVVLDLVQASVSGLAIGCIPWFVRNYRASFAAPAAAQYVAAGNFPFPIEGLGRG